MCVREILDYNDADVVVTLSDGNFHLRYPEGTRGEKIIMSLKESSDVFPILLKHRSLLRSVFEQGLHQSWFETELDEAKELIRYKLAWWRIPYGKEVRLTPQGVAALMFYPPSRARFPSVGFTRTLKRALFQKLKGKDVYPRYRVPVRHQYTLLRAKLLEGEKKSVRLTRMGQAIALQEMISKTVIE